MQTPNELMPDGLQMDLLWKNASPTSEFPAQTIKLDVSNYKMLIVGVKSHSAYTDVPDENMILPTIQGTYMCHIHIGENCIRRISISESEISFGDAVYTPDYATPPINATTAINTCYIPTKIYGVK